MRNLMLYSLLWIPFVAFAQQEKDRYLPKANEEFESKKYAEAEANYRISQSKFPKQATASYNLGNTIYTINQPSEAKSAYFKAIENAKSRPKKHQIYHNLGNVFMKEKEYTNAVQAYKMALVNDPSDDETRYNYALAKKMLKENPPKKDDKDKKDDKKDDKKKDEEKQKKEKDKEQDDKKDLKGKDEKDEPKEQGEKPKPQEGSGISQQRLDNLLDAVNNEEKKVQDKMNVRKGKGKPVQTEKDW